MRDLSRHISRLLSSKFVVRNLQILTMLMSFLLLTACASEPTEVDELPKEKPVLKIYLFAPESPIITRADIGDVGAANDEKAVKTLDVWVFEHLSPNKFVSYIHLDDLSFDGQKEIAMEISDEFADLAKKPEVDIYVAANASKANEASYLGLSLNKNSALADLKAACISSDYFGVYPEDPTKLVTSVPAEGLPMSGMLENQKISGIPPVYTAKAKNVKLVRAVSKVRFILSKSSPPTIPPTISDLSINLDANMLPKEEYLFLEDEYPEKRSHVKTTGEDVYETAATLKSGVNGDGIKSCTNPADYAYTSETGQAYEAKINSGIEANELSEYGPFYLRESDKQLTGTISYKLGVGENASQKSVEFKMSGAGDFTRNHTWIVYGYFLGSGELKLNVVDVKAWTEDTSNPKVYNW